MSKLVLTRKDVEEAVRKYYQEHQPELYTRYNFDRPDMYSDEKKLGYLDSWFTIDERLDLENLPTTAVRYPVAEPIQPTKR